ncbi:MAG: hypothetical protein PHG41_05540 [Actinomycetota bacterium]|nr:hypothetical protein [Actinomycetota bacterium]
MKALRFIIPILVLVLVFGVTACTSPELEQKVADLEKELASEKQVVRELESELAGTKYKLDLANKTIKELEAEQVEVVEEEPTVEEAEEDFMESVKGLIEEGFGGKLTKLTWNEDFTELYLAYNTKWASDKRIQKEIYDITLCFASSDYMINLDIVATSDMGDTIHTYTPSEVMEKMANFEISYEEWLAEAF